MDTLFSLRVFREVIRCGSFTRAADKLGISTAMASKHVSHLEKQVCAKLLQSNSRNLHLTEAGEQYHRCCVQALETLDTAAERAAGGADTPFPYLTHAEELFEYLGEGDTFVVDTSGSVIGRFDAAVEPDELEVTDLIESNLPI